MEKYLNESLVMERKAVFNRSRSKRYELTFECKSMKAKKSILVVGLNAASDDIRVLDTTTTFLLNHLIPMGYSTITIFNLYADICKKLKPSEIGDNEENMKYLQELLKRKFDTILIGYGNTFIGNQLVKTQKRRLQECLELYKDKVVDLVDEAGTYGYLRAVHPLMAGRYYPHQWKLRPFDFKQEENKHDEAERKTGEEPAFNGTKGEIENETVNTDSDNQSVVFVETAK